MVTAGRQCGRGSEWERPAARLAPWDVALLVCGLRRELPGLMDQSNLLTG
jgi:hypothetical protein